MKFETLYTEEYGEIRLGWIRLLYGATAFLGITVGSTMLIAPDFSRKVVGIPFSLPVQDPITYGALAGIWTTVGILCCFGLRDPLQFLPLFTLQLVYKSFWFAFVFFALIFQGEFPNHGWASAVGNLIWMLLDIKSIPWKFLLSKDKALGLAALRAKSIKRAPIEPPLQSQAA
ncbi:MAG: hypothetical protein AAF664_05630 [Planctomycetota bacterium]